jgi:hypothetical protein
MTCGSSAPPSKASQTRANSDASARQCMHHGAVKATKAILRAVGSQSVVTGRQARRDSGGGSSQAGAHGLARSSSSKVSAVSWSTVAVQRLLMAKRPSNGAGGLIPRRRPQVHGAQLDSAVLAKLASAAPRVY